MKRTWVILIAAFFFAAPAAAQQKFAPTAPSRREAIARGQGKEFLAAMEALGSETENKERWSEASHAYIHASAAASATGQLQKAISYGAKAVELGQKARNATRETHALLVLAHAYGQVGQGEKENEMLQKARETVKQIKGDRGTFEGLVYLHLGNIYLGKRQIKEATDYLSYALQVLETRLSYLKSRPGAPTRNVKAALYNTETHRIRTVRALGLAYMRSGNLPEAIKVLERAMVILAESGLKNDVQAQIASSLGQAYLAQKDFPRALEILTNGLQMAVANQQTVFIQNMSSAIANIFLQTGKPSEAIPHYKKAIDSIESTRSLLESEELRTSFFENKGQTYGGIILAHLGAKNVKEAFNYNERARSRAFLDILGSKVQLAHGALLEEERALQARISALQAGMRVAEESDDDEEGEESAPKRRDPRQELEQAQQAYGDFLAKVRKENKEQASLMNVEPLTLKQTQELLEPGVTMLEYFVAPDQLVLWVVERERVEFVRIPVRRRELVSKVSAFRESVLQLEEKEKFRVSSQELYKLLIEPALQHVRGKELLIVPYDVLHYLPFQALLSAQGKYLIQDYPIHYLSSASLMQFTREKKRAGGEQALVMGNPSLGDEAYNLRFAEREAKEVANVYPKSAVYLRAEASKSRAISLSPKYDMLHFAVHAELNEEDPMSSALLLAGDGKDDGRLKVGEIFSLNLKAGMVVLSACETGLGKLNSGDEMVGLTRAFIYAGTPSVVTTLWKVNDRSSYELMREFYQRLKTVKKSEALRQAQLKTMKEFPEPFYWAAYQPTGEP